MFSGKKLLITGGTGSFGNAILDRLLGTEIAEIRILSRDEKKQEDMRKRFKSEKLRFYIGDVRDRDSIFPAMNGIDFVFHAAALKQVPSCEFYPMEAVKTNVIGTSNVLDAGIEASVKKIICLSTDKAVYPINAMGMSKAMMEKVAIAKSRESIKTVIAITRYGNVIGSRGSVIPLFIDQIRQNIPITITNPQMTRFMMTLDNAVDLVIYAFQNSNPGEIFIQKAPAATIEILTKALLRHLNLDNYPLSIIGTRHGEKLYEALISNEERFASKDLGSYFMIPPDLRDLNYEKFTEKGVIKINQFEDYNSHNTERLDVSAMLRLLQKSDVSSLI